MDLPYRYKDVDGDRLAVFTADIPGKGNGVNVRTDRPGCSVPTADAPALARAVLAAAGDTEHTVTSWRECHLALRTAREEGARSMRERVAEVIDVWSEGHGVADTSDYIGAAIRALPLFPAETASTPLTADNTKEAT